MNEVEFYRLAAELRARRDAALRMLRDSSKKCRCERCKSTVAACREALRRGR